jgi:hypothetical protein
MKKVFLLVAILVYFAGCSKDIEGFAELPNPGLPSDSPADTVANPEIPSDNQSDTDTNPEIPSDNPVIPSPTPINPPYQVPQVKSASDFANIIYIDPTYTRGDSDGTIGKPYPDMNKQFSKGVPANTAFLFKSGTVHPKIGRSPSPLDDMIYKNNLIGAYGEGKRPVIGGIWVAGNSDGLTIRDLNISAISQAGTDSWDILIMLYGDAPGKSSPINITIAYNIINGLHNPGGSWTSSNGPRPYPHMGIRGGGRNIVIFNNSISNVGSNGAWLGGSQGLKVVRNYVYNVNRAHWGRGIQGTTTVAGGDGIQITYRFAGAYVAGNYINVGKDYYSEHPNGNDFWKHALIMNASPTGGWDSPAGDGVTVEYNTIYSQPLGKHSSPIIYYNPPRETRFRNNLIAPAPGRVGRTPMAGSGVRVTDHLKAKGISNNHFIRRDPSRSDPVTYPENDGIVLDNQNRIFNNWADYESFTRSNPRAGSDIDPNNFW